MTAQPVFSQDDAGRSWLEDVAALAGAEGLGAERSRRLTTEKFMAYLVDADVEATSRQAVAIGWDRGLRRTGRSLRSLPAGPAAEALVPLFATARDQSQSAALEPNRRARAARVVGLGPLDGAMATLPTLLDARHPVEVQLAALQALGDLPDLRVGPAVVARWKALSPPVRREAAEVLFARPERLRALLDSLEARLVEPGELDSARVAQLVSHRDGSIRQRAQRHFGTMTRGDRGRVVAAMRPALKMAGDPSKGVAIFEKACATCHPAQGRGESVGPDLATIAGRTAEDLLIHILDPNREVPPAYLDYRIATTDGRVVTGMIASETAAAVTLKRAGGVVESVPREAIEAIASSGLSLMPEGLEVGLSTEDFADLLAYLRGLKPAR